MAYLHGTYGQFEKSLGTVPTQSDTVAVYVGLAPVNLIRGYQEKDLINYPIQLKDMTSAQQKIGYSTDIAAFSLCEAMEVHFANTIENAGPIVVINALDPDLHRKSEAVTEEIAFINGRASIVSDKIILDTLVLADMVEDVDYTLDYDYSKSTATISYLGDKTPESVHATYQEIDLEMIEDADLIGGVTSSGVYSGLGAVGLVYPELGLIPNILAAPGYSQIPAVYQAMVQAAKKINGHWDACLVADIPVMEDETAIDTKELAVKWKKEHDYTSEYAKVCYPMWQLKDGKIYHLSTLTVWLMLLVDGTHNGVPMESPSNKQLPSGRQYYGEGSKNRGYDQQQANDLNENGITTGIYWGGRNVLWGPHTAAYQYSAVTDKRVIFDNSLRTMMYISNSFQQEHAITIDSPMTRAMADSIRNREQEKADALTAIGALIGTPVVAFKETENSTDALAEGDFVWNFEGTPTPPFKSGTLKVAYTDAGFATFLGEE